jgi:hypothetical protein
MHSSKRWRDNPDCATARSIGPPRCSDGGSSVSTNCQARHPSPWPPQASSRDRDRPASYTSAGRVKGSRRSTGQARGVEPALVYAGDLIERTCHVCGRKFWAGYAPGPGPFF